MGASHHGLGNLIAMVDINALQADGPTAGVLRTEPVADKWAACGWHGGTGGRQRCRCAARRLRRRQHRCAVGHPVRHQDRRGVPLLENREKAHFMRIDSDEWQVCRDQLTQGHQGSYGMSAPAKLNDIGDDRLVRRSGPRRPPRPRSGTHW